MPQKLNTIDKIPGKIIKDLLPQSSTEQEIETLNDFFVLHPMTHEQLAELLGCATVTVSSWNHGARRISNQSIRHLNRLHILLELGVEKHSKGK